MDAQVEGLSSLFQDDHQLRAEARRRRDSFEFVTVYPNEEEKYAAKGWELFSSGASKLKLRKAKTHDTILEDRVWSLLHKLGYPVLSDQNFRVRYKRPDGPIAEREISVFAKDSETCLVVECKSREKRGKRNLQNAILETATSQRGVNASLTKAMAAPSIEAGVTQLRIEVRSAFAESVDPARQEIGGEFLADVDVDRSAGEVINAIRGAVDVLSDTLASVARPEDVERQMTAGNGRMRIHLDLAQLEMMWALQRLSVDQQNYQLRQEFAHALEALIDTAKRSYLLD
ncbi:hypothetical protein [Reyranella soli]|nr:hypothetical protein [Reyranella soli]